MSIEERIRHRPSAAVMAALLGEPVPVDWRQRLDQADGWRAEGQKRLAEAEAVKRAGQAEEAQRVKNEAAAYELCGVLRRCSPRQLEALRREAWTELAGPSTEEERAADETLGQGGLARLVTKLLSLLLHWLFGIQLSIGQPESARRQAVDMVMPIVLDAIGGEQQARHQAAERRHEAEVLAEAEHQQDEDEENEMTDEQRRQWRRSMP